VVVAVVATAVVLVFGAADASTDAPGSILISGVFSITTSSAAPLFIFRTCCKGSDTVF